MSEVSVSFRVDFSPDCAVGPGKIALLEHIASSGSLSEAAVFPVDVIDDADLERTSCADAKAPDEGARACISDRPPCRRQTILAWV